MPDFRKLFKKRFNAGRSIILTKKARIGLYCTLAVLATVGLIALISRSNPFFSSPEILRAQRRGVLRVGVRTDAPGFAYNGEGLEIDLARALTAKIFPNSDPLIMLELVELTQFTAQARLQSGDVDIVFAMQRPNTTSYTFSLPYYYDTVAVIVRRDMVNTSLDGKVFAVVASSKSNAATRLTEYTSRTDIEIFATGLGSYPDIANMLLTGNIDYAAVPGYFVPAMLEYEGLAVHSENLGTLEYAAMSNNDEQAFANIAGLMIDEMSKSGELDALIKKHGLTSYQ